MSQKWPSKGTQLLFLGKNGYDHKLAEALTLMQPGQVFTCVDCEVGSWSNSVALEEFPGKRFNGVLFSMNLDDNWVGKPETLGVTFMGIGFNVEQVWPQAAQVDATLALIDEIGAYARRCAMLRTEMQPQTFLHRFDIGQVRQPDARQDELLKANTRYLMRARKAEDALRSLVKKITGGIATRHLEEAQAVLNEPWEPGDPEVEVQYEIWTGKDFSDFAASSDTRQDADHYLLMYGQDGPVRLTKATTMRQVISDG